MTYDFRHHVKQYSIVHCVHLVQELRLLFSTDHLTRLYGSSC
jgi:hypothetical protein